MRVMLETTGGLGAAINLAAPPRVVDTAALADGPRTEFERLLAAAIDAQSSSSAPPNRAAADAMTYRVTVDRGDGSAAYIANDVDLTDEFAALIDWFTAHSGD